MYASNLRRVGAATRPRGGARRSRVPRPLCPTTSSSQYGRGLSRDATTDAGGERLLWSQARERMKRWARMPSASSVAGTVALVPVIGGAWLLATYSLRQRLCEHHLQQVHCFIDRFVSCVVCSRSVQGAPELPRRIVAKEREHWSAAGLKIIRCCVICDHNINVSGCSWCEQSRCLTVWCRTNRAIYAHPSSLSFLTCCQNHFSTYSSSVVTVPRHCSIHRHSATPCAWVSVSVVSVLVSTYPLQTMLMTCFLVECPMYRLRASSLLSALYASWYMHGTFMVPVMPPPPSLGPHEK